MRGRGCKLTRGSQKHSHFQLPWVCACLLLESPRSVQRILALVVLPGKSSQELFQEPSHPFQTAWDSCKPSVKTLSLVVTGVDYQLKTAQISHHPYFVPDLRTGHLGAPEAERESIPGPTVNQLSSYIKIQCC